MAESQFLENVLLEASFNPTVHKQAENLAKALGEVGKISSGDRCMEVWREPSSKRGNVIICAKCPYEGDSLEQSTWRVFSLSSDRDAQHAWTNVYGPLYPSQYSTPMEPKDAYGEIKKIYDTITRKR